MSDSYVDGINCISSSVSSQRRKTGYYTGWQSPVYCSRQGDVNIILFLILKVTKNHSELSFWLQMAPDQSRICFCEFVCLFL